MSRTFYISSVSGNDNNTGLSEDFAFKTIDKINSYSLVPGDTILFKRGETFEGTIVVQKSGTNNKYITYGAYGIGNDPIITPNKTIAGLTWELVGNGVYKTTDIPYSAGNILIDGKRIGKINDEFWSTQNTSWGNLTALEILNLSADSEFTFGGEYIKLFDIHNVLYAYDGSGTTYVRFKNGENPNNYTFKVSSNVSAEGGMYLLSKNYIKVSNLKFLGGKTGIHIIDGGFERAFETIVIDSCSFDSCNYKILISSTSGITVKNSQFTNNYLSDYICGAWSGSLVLDNVHKVAEGFYRFYKTLEHPSDSSIDSAISMNGGYSDNCKFYSNTVDNCTDGIICFGSNVFAYYNIISNISSVGISLAYKAPVSAYGNQLTNCNFAFRFDSVDGTDFSNRVYHVYRNRVYNPIAGSFVYFHSYNNGASVIKAYLYNNSVASVLGVGLSGYLNMTPEKTGFVFINNIISTILNATYGWVGMANYSSLMEWFNNWSSGGFYPDASPVWADNSNIIESAENCFWNTATIPDYTNTAGKGVIDTGLNIQEAFVLNGINYSALPDIVNYIGNPDIGWHETTLN